MCWFLFQFFPSDSFFQFASTLVMIDIFIQIFMITLHTQNKKCVLSFWECQFNLNCRKVSECRHHQWFDAYRTHSEKQLNGIERFFHQSNGMRAKNRNKERKGQERKVICFTKRVSCIEIVECLFKQTIKPTDIRLFIVCCCCFFFLVQGTVNKTN